MDIAIVTGAETPLGLRLIEDLIRQGCRVHGIGNNLSNIDFADPQFVAHAIDLSDIAAVTKTTEAILEQEKRLHILIHAIDVTPGASFEQLPVGNLEAILKIGLLGPVMLTRLALPNLLRFRGQLINIIPANKSGHIPSAVNALIEGGLREMNTALFDQARDSGLRVTNLVLRQNTAIDPSASSEKIVQTRIDPEDVARTVEQLLDPHVINVPNEITLYPRLSAAAETTLPSTPLPIDPYNAIILPPKEYFPPEVAPITTKQPDKVDRVIPYTDEEMEDKIASAIEDYEAHPERYERPEKTEKRKKKQQERPAKQARKENQPPRDDTKAEATEQQPEQEATEQHNADSDQSKSRRGRRRGGRNRNRNREREPQDNNRSNQDRPQSEPARSESENSAPVVEKAPNKEISHDSKPAKKPRGRNRSRKPVTRIEEKYADYQAPAASINELSKKPVALPSVDTAKIGEIKSHLPQVEKTTQQPRVTKPVKKKTAKKPAVDKPQQMEFVSDAKPAVKKKAAKKSATKKAAKKAVKKTATKKAAKKAAKKTASKKAVKKRVKKEVE